MTDVSRGTSRTPSCSQRRASRRSAPPCQRESWTLAVARVTGKAIAAAGASRHTRSMNQVTPHTSHWGAFDAVVQNGRIVDVRPFARDADPSPIIYGAADAVHAANRIDRPYVRKGWLNGDGSGGTPRGNDPFVPLDWDQATRLVADELTRVRDAHGPASVFGGCYGWSSAGRFHHAKTQVQRMLAATGGFTNSVTSYSHAAAQMLLPHVVGDFDCALGPIADWRGIARHAKLMICFGGIALRNGQVTNGGGGVHEMRHWLRQASQAGVRLVNVSPQRCDMPDEIACEWLPIRPGTDTALMLAMAYVLIDEDRIDHAIPPALHCGFRTCGGLCARRGRRHAEDAGVGCSRDRHPRRHHRRCWRATAPRADHADRLLVAAACGTWRAAVLDAGGARRHARAASASPAPVSASASAAATAWGRHAWLCHRPA